MQPADPFLTLEESTRLLHPLVDRVARDLGVRILHIKGHALQAQHLRVAHTSVDVDVLVESVGMAPLLSQLGALGWAVPIEPTSAQVLPLHSDTLRHPGWPCELDVHHRFPGFLAPPDAVFDALWDRRTEVMIAGTPVPTPDRLGHSLVAALHWLRDGWSTETGEKLEYLARSLAPLSGEERDQLVALAHATGAAEPARQFLAVLGLHATSDGIDSTLWRIRTASTGVKGVGWVVELRRTPLRKMPGRLWHALVLTEAEIRNEQPDARPGEWGLFLARLRRLRYGLRDLPKAVRIVWREGRLR